MNVHGPRICPRPCADCADPGTHLPGTGGPHHWIETCLDADDLTDDDHEDYQGPIDARVYAFLACKHCDAWTTDEEDLDNHQRCYYCNGLGQIVMAPGEPIGSVRCQSCNGTGTSTECLACDGTGVDRFAANAGEECSECAGTGNAPQVEGS